MKFRPYHILKGNKGGERPQHVIFFDTETTPISINTKEEKHVLKVGWFCYMRTSEIGTTRHPRWVEFSTPDQFWNGVNKVLRPNTRVYLVGHNVAFDFRIVKGFDYAKKHGWEEKFIYDKGLTTILRYTYNKCSIEIISSTNFFAMTLKDLGKLVGIPKIDVDFKTTSKETLSLYCKRDVEIIIAAWKLWLAFLDKHDFGGFRRTLSSQAFSAYRHRFMDTPITIHGNTEVCELERKAYRGGRTECFRVGEFTQGPYYYLDVNGMYGFAMMKNKYPYKYCGQKDSFSIPLLVNKLRNFAVVAKVVISTDQPVFVYKHNDRNIYPVGVFETVLTTPELKYAIEHNMLLEIKQMSWYRQTYIFENYVDYLNLLKERYEKDNNPAFRKIAKLFINALYGKFGQKAIDSRVVIQPNANAKLTKGKRQSLLGRFGKRQTKHYTVEHGTFNRETGEWKRPADWKWHKPTNKTIQESYNSFPAIVAHVTAYARMYLWSLIVKADRENTFYCDTDSLIVNQAGLNNLKDLIDDHKLGYLKIEKQGPTLTINAPKDYSIGNRTRIKGIRKNAIQLKDNVFEQDQFLGLSGAIRRGEPDLVTIKRITKTLYRRIETGTVGLDGWITPFNLPLPPNPQ